MNRTDERTANEAAAIRNEIDQTRAGMSRTVNALEERLSPANIKQQANALTDTAVAKVTEEVGEKFRQAKTAVHDATIGKVDQMVRDARDTASEAGTTVLEMLKQNPIPTAMVALGAGWLFLNRRVDGRPARSGEVVREGTSRLVQGAEQAARDASEQIGGLVSETGARVEQLAGEAKQTGERAVERAQIGARRLEYRIQNVMRENPMGVGALALAVGAATALALPRTRREDELLGATKDKLLERAEGVARGALSTAEEKVEALSSGTQDDSAGETEIEEEEGIETVGPNI